MYNCQRVGSSKIFDDPRRITKRVELDQFDKWNPIRGNKTKKQCWDILWKWRKEAGLIFGAPGVTVGYETFNECCPKFMDQMTQTVDLKAEKKYLENPLEIKHLTEQQRDPNFEDDTKYSENELAKPPPRFSFQNIVANVMRMFGGKNKLLDGRTLEIVDGIFCYGCQRGHIKYDFEWYKCTQCNRTYCRDAAEDSDNGLLCDDCGSFVCCEGETYYWFESRDETFCQDCAPFQECEMNGRKDPVEDVDE